MASNYITIDLAGQKVGLKFGFHALQQIAEKEKNVPFYSNYPTEEDPTQTITTWSELAYAHIICAGYCNNQYLKDEPVTIPFETFYYFVEDAILAGKEKMLATLQPIIDSFTSNPLYAKHIAAQGKMNEPVQPTQRAETPKKKYK